MILFVRYVLLLTVFFSSVLALPLVLRDVVDPPVTTPTSATVWHVGQVQTVTWNAAGLPVNQTNPVGMLVLGYQYNNSENLMLNSPLATNLNYSVGQAQITVPDVPTRTDYIVVLFGDSGNASPEFTIINDALSSAPTTSAAGTPAPSPPSPSPPSPGNSGGSAPTPVTGAPATGPLTTAAVPSSHATSHLSTTVTVKTSGTHPATQSNAAWQKYVPSLGTPLGVALVAICLVFS